MLDTIDIKGHWNYRGLRKKVRKVSQRKEGQVHRKEERQGMITGLPGDQVARVKTDCDMVPLVS